MGATVTGERVRLWGFSEDWKEAESPVRALLFGEMVRRALPVVEEYHSDLFHDALWVASQVNGPTSFEWMPRTSGTFIGTDLSVPVEVGQPGAVWYRVDLTVERGSWFVTFTRKDIPS